MRTKTLALSALLGMIGGAAAIAQNVYSVNAVGYINLTFPANSYTILTCPLICSPDNTLNTILPNTNNQYKKAKVYGWASGNYTVTESGQGTTVGNPTGWAGGGADITLNPGNACFFYNSTTAAMSATFVGTVPQNGSYNMTNLMNPGWNLLGSIVPASGDLSTNPITQLTNIFKKDFVYTYDQVTGYSPKDSVAAPGGGSGYNNQWTGGDPQIEQVGFGFFYWNNQSTNNPWVENFTINP